MKKLLFLMMAMDAFSMANAHDIKIEVSPEAETYAYSVGDEDQSISSSTSTSTSNGKTSRSISTTKSYTKGVKSLSDLAVYPLFEKYKRSKNVKMTEIDGRNLYLSLTVADNPTIMADIRRKVEIDSKKAYSSVKNYNENGDNISLNLKVDGSNCVIGFQINAEGNSGSIYLSYRKPNEE